jgi:hypothetical protein
LVTHAGAIPGRRRGVTLQCGGGLRATLLGLATTAVRRGARVRAGDRVGAAAGPTLRLGARESADAFGYVDPLVLLGADPDATPPLGRAPRGVRLPPPPRAVPQPAPPAARPSQPAPQAAGPPQPAAAPDAALGSAARPDAAPAAAPRHAPLAPLLGIALLAAATGAGRLTHRRTRRSPLARRAAGATRGGVPKESG